MIIRKFLTEIIFTSENKEKKQTINKDRELEKENRIIEGPILGKVKSQKTPSFISKIIFSNQKAKGAIPNLKKQNIITNIWEKISRHQENISKREKISWKIKYLKKGKREFLEKLTKQKGNKETDIKIRQHQNLIREKSWQNKKKHPNNQEIILKKRYKKIRKFLFLITKTSWCKQDMFKNTFVMNKNQKIL